MRRFDRERDCRFQCMKIWVGSSLKGCPALVRYIVVDTKYEWNFKKGEYWQNQVGLARLLPYKTCIIFCFSAKLKKKKRAKRQTKICNHLTRYGVFENDQNNPTKKSLHPHQVPLLSNLYIKGSKSKMVPADWTRKTADLLYMHYYIYVKSIFLLSLHQIKNTISLKSCQCD